MCCSTAHLDFFSSFFPKWTFHTLALLTVCIAYNQQTCNSIHSTAVRKAAGAGQGVLMAPPGPHHSACRCIVVRVLSENDDATCIKIETLLFPQAIILRDTKCKQYKVTGGEVIQD